jgi:ATP-binding cassette subfamily F protein 3
MEIVRGQKIAFVGQNGQGKSTLVKILAENLDFKGEIEPGHKISLGYYAQNQSEALDGSITVLETIENSAPEKIRIYARKMLGNFMFTGDDVEKKVSVLSGGERGRLALCQLMLNPINFLILDEPTNHLDMQAKDVLKKSLASYDGTLIVVSHDREFLSDLASVTYEFKGGKVKQHLGGIEYFLDQKKMQNMRQVELGIQEKSDSKENKKKTIRNSRDKFKKIEREFKSAQNHEKSAQKVYENLQHELDILEEILSNPIEFKKKSGEPGFYKKYEDLKIKLENSFIDWEKTVEKSSALNEELKKLET